MPTSAAFDRTIRGAIRRELQPRLVTNAIVNRDLVRGSFEEPEDTVELVDMDSLSVSDYNGGFGGSVQDLQADNIQITADHAKGFRFKAEESDSASQIADRIAQQDGCSGSTPARICR